MDRTDEITATTVIKWAWHNYSLTADTFDSVRDAVINAEGAAEAGEESLVCIEVIGPDGSHVLTDVEYYSITNGLMEQGRAAYEAQPKAVAIVRIRPPDTGNHWANYDSYPTLDEANQEADRFRSMLGPERVKVDPIR